MARTSIKMSHAALDDEKGEIILRGVIDPNSLSLLKVGPYQREILPLAKIRQLQAAFTQGGAVPDIDLGMRGGSFTERDSSFYLQDEVFIIDGLQRQTAALECIRENLLPRLGGVVHFNTTEKWEKERFRILNMFRSKLSPSVLIRNMRTDYQSVEMLYNLTNDTSFVLYHKVSWNQRMQREHLITALTFLKATARLHEAMTPGMIHTSYEILALNLDKLIKSNTRNIVRNNIKAFWEVLDDCFGVRTVHFKEGAVYLRSNFLFVIAAMFANHENFWRDNVFFVDKKLRNKIKLFPLSDPNIANLCGAGGAARKLIYRMLIDHINSGRRTQRLVPIRKSSMLVEDEIVGGGDETEVDITITSPVAAAV